MVFTRIIPRLDIKNSCVIKTVCFEGLRIIGKPSKLLIKYYLQGADELLYMDLVASLYQRQFDFDLLREVSRDIFIPLTVGGGIRTIADIKKALRAGADKVAINTAAVCKPDLIKQAVEIYGSQCVVLSIEAKKIFDGNWEVYTNAGREKTGMDVMDWIGKMQAMGVGEIILSSIDNEGLKCGYDLELLKAVKKICRVPLIIHGGAGNLNDFFKAFQAGADAVSAASIFHYNLSSVDKTKDYLVKKGLKARA